MVDYTPWLGGGTLTNPGFSGDFSALWVDDDSPQATGGGGGGGRIQEAVDMVSGSTVNVLAGSYTGHVVIEAPLNLLGPNVGINPNTGIRVDEAVITTDDMTNHQAVLIQSADVMVDGFTMYGPKGPSRTSAPLVSRVPVPAPTSTSSTTGSSGPAGGRLELRWSSDRSAVGIDASIAIEHNRIDVGPAMSEGNNGLTLADHAYRMVNGGTWVVGSTDRAIIRDNYLYGHSKMYIEGIGVLIEGNWFLGNWGPIEVRGAKDVVIHENQMVDQTDIGIFAWSPLSASGAGVCTDLGNSRKHDHRDETRFQALPDMGTAVVVAGVTLRRSQAIP